MILFNQSRFHAQDSLKTTCCPFGPNDKETAVISEKINCNNIWKFKKRRAV